MRHLLLPANRLRMISVLLAAAVILVAMPALAGHIEAVDVNGVTVQAYVPDIPAAQTSADGKTLWTYNPVIMLDDPNPPAYPLHIPPPAALLEKTADVPAGAGFNIIYVPAGGQDPWGKTCTTFPEEAKAVFNTAANIWGGLLNSNVPITISACWADLGSTSTLGYSGGAPLHRDFENAPKPGTWYKGSLANSLAGTDLNTNSADMYITYNLNFAWYYGTDGNTPPDRHDLLSVVLHEICHGLNFSGSMVYSNGQGGWGFNTPYPDVYDTFVYDGSGHRLVDTNYYFNPSTSLGTALTSGLLYFQGTNSMSANGGQAVRIYAPSTWSPGSSYAHLDYNTFASTPNALMVYAIGAGVSRHDPGPVTLGLLKDLGWSIGGSGGSANLAPYQPSGWSDAIVVSKSTGTSSDDGSITPSDTIYIDWAAINNGSANIGTRFYSTLAVDGTDVHNWSTDSLQAGYYAYVQDYVLGTLGAGWHTITMRVDSTNAIAEGNEGDNVYEKYIYVSQPAYPNLKPYKPSGWSNKLVLTHYQGDTVDSRLYSGYEIYVDWAAANLGSADINKKFYCKLYIDGYLVKSWYTKKLAQGNYVYVIGEPIGGLDPGTHQFKLIVDTPNKITETKENDNQYTRNVTVR